MAERVEFHTGVADKFDYACRLLRKAWRGGVRVCVTAPAPELARLDHELWTFEAREFIPHLRIGAQTSAAQAARTPIWLVDGDPPPAAPSVLVNLGAGAPADAARFERIIEVVSEDPAEAEAGRLRWRDYKARGLEISHLPAPRR